MNADSSGPLGVMTFRKATRPHGAEGPGLEAERWEEADAVNTLAGHGTTTSTAVVSPSVEMAVRRLTPLECERLQGWADGHTEFDADGKALPDSTRYRMVGNGVASPVVEWIGRRIADYENSHIDTQETST